jgi:stalled ribosome alternative rescue factor ArfA|tara:strand:- start:206 stop:316 length:111 start_codon:yes stop_codon:yes gene_type:complete
MVKKNPVAKNLRSKRYKPRIVKPKKGKGSYRRKKLI